jgi:transforming growth factor-beta-induced protein
VIPSTAFSGDLSDGQTLTTVQGEDLTVGIDAESGDVTLTDVNGTTVNVGPADIGASNGVLHEIDGVVLPTLDILETATVGGFGTLVELVDAAGLTATLQTDNGGDGWTVFAPTDDAFADLPTTPEGDLLSDILTYHVVSGTVMSTDLSDGQEVTTVNEDLLTVNIDEETDQVTLTDATGSTFVVGPVDVEASNGVIHVVDGVLTPGLDLVQTATLAGFSTLVGLVEDAGLTATLQSDNGGEGWTVFAPTNAAFEALSSVPEGAALEAVLLYHVVSGTVLSGDLSDGDIVTTENGDTFTVAINEVTGAVTISDASGGTVNVSPVDVPATNGVIHVIDGVLLPAP